MGHHIACNIERKNVPALQATRPADNLAGLSF
jgi:hypothetical protein